MIVTGVPSNASGAVTTGTGAVTARRNVSVFDATLSPVVLVATRVTV